MLHLCPLIFGFLSIKLYLLFFFYYHNRPFFVSSVGQKQPTLIKNLCSKIVRQALKMIHEGIKIVNYFTIIVSSYRVKKTNKHMFSSWFTVLVNLNLHVSIYDKYLLLYICVYPLNIISLYVCISVYILLTSSRSWSSKVRIRFSIFPF